LKLIGQSDYLFTIEDIMLVQFFPLFLLNSLARP